MAVRCRSVNGKHRARLLLEMTARPIKIVGSLFMARKKKKSYLAFAIITAVLVAAVVAGVFLFQARKMKAMLQVASTSKPGAQPPHIRWNADAPVNLEEICVYERVSCLFFGH